MYDGSICLINIVKWRASEGRTQTNMGEESRVEE